MYLYLLHWTKARPTYAVWWAYEGEAEHWAEEEVERELAGMNGSLEKLAGLEEKEEEEVHGSETCLRES